MRTTSRMTLGWRAAITGVLLAGAMPAGAGDRTWDGGGASNYWSAVTNWDGNLTAPGAGDTLVFAGSTKLANTNDLAADTSFAGITFNSGAGAFILAGTGNRITLGGNVTNNSASLQTLNLPMILGATRTFDTASSGSLSAGGILSGAGGLTKAGAQTLTLANNTNTFTGPVAIQAGTLKVDALNYVTAGDWFAHATGSSLGKPATEADGTIAIGSGTSTGTLYRTGTSNEVTDRVIDLAGTTGGAVIDNSGTAKTIKFASDFTATGSGAKTLTLSTTSGGIEIAGKIVDSAGGAVNVVANGTAAPILSGLSTYTGPTTINNNGGLKVNSIANLGVPSALGAPATAENGAIKLGVTTLTKTLFYFGAGNITDRVIDLAGTTGGGTLDMTGASGTLKFTSDFTASGPGAKTLTVSSSSGSWTLEFAGKIVDSTNGATSLSLNNVGGASSIILSATNTYTGLTSIPAMNVGGGVYINSIKNVNEGPSSLGNPAPGNGVIAMGSGGFPAALIYTNGTGDTTDRAIDLKGTASAITLDQSGTGLLKFTSDITANGVGPKTLTLRGATAGIGEIAGSIRDNTGLVAIATATTVITNKIKLTYVNGVAAGATIAGYGIALGTTIAAVDPSTAFITLSAQTTNAVIPLNTVLVVPGAFNPTAITKAGTGTWILSGTNSYTGPTTLSAGTLILSGPTTCTGLTTVSAGTLILGNKLALGTGGLTLGGGTLQAASDLSGVNAVSNSVIMTIGSTVSGTNNLTLGGSFTQSGNNRILLGSIGSGGRLMLAGNVYLSETNVTGRTLTLSGSGTIEISGSIANCNGGAGTAGSLVINNADTILSGTNTYTGTTTIGTGGRLQITSTNNLGLGNLIFSAGSVTGNKATLALRSDGDAAFAKNTGANFDQVNEFNVDRATPGGPANGIITWGMSSSNWAFNGDRGQLLVTGGNGYGLTLNPNLSWSGNNQNDKPNIVNNAPGLLTFQGNLAWPSVNNRWFELSGTGDILVNGNVFYPGCYIYKTGPNTVTLAGTNTWVNNGGFFVNGGTLRMAGTAAIPSNGPLTVLNGTLDFNGVSLTNTTLIMGGGAAGTASTLSTGAGSLTLGNYVTYNGNASNDNGATISGNLNLGVVVRTFTVHDSTAVAADMTVSAVIGGAGLGGLTKAGTGTLVLAVNNTYTNTTQINLGVLRLDSANALPGGIDSSGGASYLLFNGGVLGLGAGDFTRALTTAAAGDKVRFYPATSGGFAAYGADRFVNLGGATAAVTWATGGFCGGTLILGTPEATHTLDFQNPIALGSAARTIQVDDGAAAVDARLSGVISGSTAGNGLIKTGNGTLVLAAANTFNGPATVSNGTFLLNGSLGTGTVTVVASAAIGGTGTVDSAKLTLNSGAKLSVTVYADGTSDALTVSGALDVSNLSLDVVNTNLLNGAYKYAAVKCGSHAGTFVSDNLPAGWVVDYALAGSIRIRRTPQNGVVIIIR